MKICHLDTEVKHGPCQIRQCRLVRGYSQVALCRSVNEELHRRICKFTRDPYRGTRHLSDTQLSRIERHTEIPKADLIAVIAKILKVKMDDLWVTK
jgi:transcriptional regulator with XRE-family HTH domain